MKKRRRKQKFDKQMQKKLLGVFAFVLLVLVILNLRIAYINIKSGDKYAKQVLSQKGSCHAGTISVDDTDIL